MEPFLRAQLSRDEGRVLETYRDKNGHWTVGVGHLVQLDPDRKIAVPRITRITDAECDAFLVADVEVATAALGRVLGFALSRVDPPRFRALVNMMFNRGEERVRESTTITPCIKTALVADFPSGAWAMVGEAILASEWGQQIGDRGKRLAEQFRTGVDQ
jgi:lysozyme